MVATNFGYSITDQDVKEAIGKRLGNIAISPDAIARGILYAIEQPPRWMSGASSSVQPLRTKRLFRDSGFNELGWRRFPPLRLFHKWTESGKWSRFSG